MRSYIAQKRTYFRCLLFWKAIVVYQALFFLNVRIQVNGFQACCVGTVANTKSTVLIWYSITSKITQSSLHFNKSSLTLVFSFWKEKISACFHNCFVVCSTWQPNCSAPTTISLPNGDESFFVWVMMTPPYLCCSLISFAQNAQDTF